MEASNVVGSDLKSEVRIADQDGFGVRRTGPETSVRVQIKKGDPIPADVELEGGTSSAKKKSGRGNDDE